MTQRYLSQRILLGLIIFLSVFSLGLQLNETTQVPLDKDYLLAKQALLEENYAIGPDALAIIPAWSLRPLKVLGDLDPISADMLHRLPALPYKRVFVLQEADAADIFDSIQEIYGAPTKTWALGSVRLHVFTTNAEYFGTLAHHIESALVTLEKGDLEKDCQWRNHQHRCLDGTKESYVAGKWMRTTQNASYLIAAPPPKNKGRLKIMFPKQVLKKNLIVFGGHTRRAIIKNAPEVNLEILLNNKTIKQVRWGRSFPMQSITIPIPQISEAQGNLTFIVSSSRSQKNQFGFDAFFSDAPIAETL